MSVSPGDWVTLKAEHDIPPMFRKDGVPTRGRVEEIDDGTVWVNVPIGDADVDEHSQAVPYLLDQLDSEGGGVGVE